MHMEMMHGLTGYFAIVLHDIQALAASLFPFHNRICKSYPDRRTTVSIRPAKLVDIIVVLLRQNQRMSLIGWCQIQNYTALWCLIYRCRWNLSICDLAENTIIFFHLYLLLFILTTYTLPFLIKHGIVLLLDLVSTFFVVYTLYTLVQGSFPIGKSSVHLMYILHHSALVVKFV